MHTSPLLQSKKKRWGNFCRIAQEIQQTNAKNWERGEARTIKRKRLPQSLKERARREEGEENVTEAVSRRLPRDTRSAERRASGEILARKRKAIKSP